MAKHCFQTTLDWFSQQSSSHQSRKCVFSCYGPAVWFFSLFCVVSSTTIHYHQNTITNSIPIFQCMVFCWTLTLGLGWIKRPEWGLIGNTLSAITLFGEESRWVSNKCDVWRRCGQNTYYTHTSTNKWKQGQRILISPWSWLVLFYEIS